MSNEVWVRWKDSTSSAGMVLVDTVHDLGDHAQIKDLRKAFVKQQVVNISPAAVVVRETENGEMLKANTVLTNYFMPPSDSAAAPGPGRSEDTALFLTVPQQQRHHLLSEDTVSALSSPAPLQSVTADLARNATLTAQNLPADYAKVARSFQERPDERVTEIIEGIEKVQRAFEGIENFPAPFCLYFRQFGNGQDSAGRDDSAPAK